MATPATARANRSVRRALQQALEGFSQIPPRSPAGHGGNMEPTLADNMEFWRYALCRRPLSQLRSCCAEISLCKLVYGMRCYLYDVHPTVLGSLPAIALAYSQFHVALS